ncbi:hypothetical protein MPTK1_2g11790 [Marchantia polymorpha subsp. ruderalis]
MNFVLAPFIGPFLYCVVVVSGCVLYFHHNCVDRRRKTAEESVLEVPLSEKNMETKQTR